ncbi:MAG TPA: 4'-phosphopantetheinyl transferase superfamily protein [Paludibacteraceae bacterium]|nr:4'-phosphopantetheinyl transferase superfamily protein [Paludibacteraceae bacterium]
MPIHDTIHTPSLDVAIWHITETADELFSMLLPNPVYTNELNRISSNKRKSEFLAVRLLMQHLVGDSTIAYLSNGKPILSGSSRFISISHTKEYVAVAISNQHEVGIDIETISAKVHQVKERFMNEIELVHAQQYPEFVLLSWVAKEAAYKKIGDGVVHFSQSMELVPFVPHLSGVLELKAQLLEETRYSFYYQQHTDFVLVYG